MSDNIKIIIELIQKEVEFRKEEGHPTKYYNALLYRVCMDISKEIIKIMERERNNKWN